MHLINVINMLNMISPDTRQKGEELIIPAGEDTAAVTLRKGLISMEGISIPSRPDKFFGPVSQWIKDYLKGYPTHTELHFKFEALDSHTLRFLYQIIKMLRDNEMPKEKTIIVNWYHQPDDYEVYDYGKLISDALKMDFNFIRIE